jgi:adenosylhomocysteine nucleosidase
MPKTLGVVTGLAFEAEILRPFAGRGLRVRAAGLAPGAAAAAAEALVADGAQALMSFGIAGGLHPEITAGHVVVCAGIRGERTIVGHETWAAQLESLLAPSIPYLRRGQLAHAARVLTSRADKMALFAETAALAADMESYAVAMVAESHGLPFIAVRAVADTAHDAVPSVAVSSMGLDGRVRYGAAVGGALTRPWQIPGLMRLGARTARAKDALVTLAGAGATGRFGLL